MEITEAQLFVVVNGSVSRMSMKELLAAVAPVGHATDLAWNKVRVFTEKRCADEFVAKEKIKKDVLDRLGDMQYSDALKVKLYAESLLQGSDDCPFFAREKT